MEQDKRQQAIALYDQYTHDGMDRRLFMARMSAIAGSAAAASALIATIGADPATAAIVPANDRRLRTSTISLLGGGGLPAYKAYSTEPANKAREASIMVIHENRGLNEHTKDVARRLALAGFHAVAVDFLSPADGTPANEDTARDMIGKLDLTASTAHAVAMVDELVRRPGGNGKVGVVGFCWGGAFVNRLAVAAGTKLAAGVSYYGVAPDSSEAARVSAPLVIHLAGLDDRVNKSAQPWVAALRAAGKPVTYFNYEGANHAFNNDSSAERFNKAAADLAWSRTLELFRRTLA
jgi:carboxymethylenebutenolidase